MVAIWLYRNLINFSFVILQLLEITPALSALNGVSMELEDCAFPTLKKIIATDDANEAFDQCDFGFLVGAMPRGPGMERSDLLEANAKIFTHQGLAINNNANKNVKILVILGAEIFTCPKFWLSVSELYIYILYVT